METTSKTITRKAYNMINLFKRLVWTTWGPQPKTKLKVYRAFQCPVVTYDFTLWIAPAFCFCRKLQIFQQHALRIAFRIKLQKPRIKLYNQTPFQHFVYQIETLRQKYIRSDVWTAITLYCTHDSFYQVISLSHYSYLASTAIPYFQRVLPTIS